MVNPAHTTDAVYNTRQNPRKKSSDQYLKKFKNVQLSQFRADKWIPRRSGYTIHFLPH